MKRFVLMWLVVMVASSVMAADCTVIEYAELKDMSKADMLHEYCASKNHTEKLLSKKPEETESFDLHMIQMGNCMEQEKRIKRVFKTKFKKNPECTK